MRILSKVVTQALAIDAPRFMGICKMLDFPRFGLVTISSQSVGYRDGSLYVIYMSACAKHEAWLSQSYIDKGVVLMYCEAIHSKF